MTPTEWKIVKFAPPTPPRTGDLARSTLAQGPCLAYFGSWVGDTAISGLRIWGNDTVTSVSGENDLDEFRVGHPIVSCFKNVRTES